MFEFLNSIETIHSLRVLFQWIGAIAAILIILMSNKETKLKAKIDEKLKEQVNTAQVKSDVAELTAKDARDKLNGLSELYKDQDKSLQPIKEREKIKSLGDKAINQGSREAFLNLQKMYEQFGPERDAVGSEIARVYSHYMNLTTINDVKLPDEEILSTKQLIEILLFDPQYKFRARSAQILATRNESYVHEALILSIFSDDNIEVMKQSMVAFFSLCHESCKYILDPYYALGYWGDNSNKIKENRKYINKHEIIPLEKLAKKLDARMDDLNYKHMRSWLITALQIDLRIATGEEIVNKAKIK